MIKVIMSNTKKHDGFTLIELLVVIAVLSILSAVSVVGYSSFIERAAISNDESYAAQLNVFKDAYTANDTGDLTVEDIKQILDQANASDIKAQSAKYGYDFYFVVNTAKFALLRSDMIDLNDGNFIKLPEGLSQEDIDAPEDTDDIEAPDDTENEDDTEVGDDAEDTEDTEDSTEKEEIDFSVLKMIYSGSNSEKSNKKPYLYADGESIEAKIDYGYESKALELDLNALKFTDGDQNYDVTALKVNGVETNTITCTGYNVLEFTLSGIDDVVFREIEVGNLFTDSEPTSVNKTEMMQNAHTYKNGTLEIMVLEGMEFTYFDGNSSVRGIWGESLDEEYMLDYIGITLVVDGKSYVIDTSDPKKGRSDDPNTLYYLKESGEDHYYVFLSGIDKMPEAYSIIYELGDKSGSFRDRECVVVNVE